MRKISAVLSKRLVLTVSLIFLGTGSVFAEVILPTHSAEVGTEISYIKYEEPDVMEETGMMYGIYGSYTFRKGFMFKADGKWSYGKVDYDGSLVNGTPYTISNIDDHILEFRGVGGYDFPVSEIMVITPYAGLGYRYLYDGLGKDVSGYDRESNYLYSPIGVEILNILSKGWSIGTTIEFDIFWTGLQKSYLSDLDAGFNNIENDQNDGYGIRGSIKFQKESDKFDFLIEPFVRYWDIGESDYTPITYNGSYIGYDGYEPQNNSLEFGSKFALKF